MVIYFKVAEFRVLCKCSQYKDQRVKYIFCKLSYTKMKRFSVFFGIILFIQIFGSCTFPIIPYSIDTKEESPSVETLIGWEEWHTIKAIKPFFAPWDYLEDETAFRCFFSSQYFYFCFNVTDATIMMCHEFAHESDVEAEDRVEIFFSASKDMRKYYCMEIDPGGHVMDYSASYYRKFNYGWNFKSLETCSIRNEKGYVVAGRLSVSELLGLGINLEEFYMGVFRADFTTPDTVVWYSSVSTDDPKPDFHKPNVLFLCMKK